MVPSITTAVPSETRPSIPTKSSPGTSRTHDDHLVPAVGLPRRGDAVTTMASCLTPGLGSSFLNAPNLRRLQRS